MYCRPGNSRKTESRPGHIKRREEKTRLLDSGKYGGVVEVRSKLICSWGNLLTRSFPQLDKEVRQKLADDYNYTVGNLKVDLSPSNNPKSSCFLEVPLDDLENGQFEQNFLTATRKCDFCLPLAGAHRDEPQKDHPLVERHQWELVPITPHSGN